MSALDSLFSLAAPGAKVDASMLELLGEKASRMFLEKKTPLSEAVRQAVADHPHLNNEHVQRVLEFANVRTFQRMHEQNEDKYVRFVPALTKDVLRGVREGGPPQQDAGTLRTGHDDYLLPPSTEQERSYNQVSHVPAAPQEKTASVSSYTPFRSDPRMDVYDQHVRLKSTRDELTDAHQQLDFVLKQAKEDLYQAVKQEVLSPEGAGLSGAAAALQKLAAEDVVTAALEPVVQRLMDEKVHHALPGRDFGFDSVKVASAGRFVNPAHPLVTSFSGMLKAAEDLLALKEAIDDVDVSLKKTKSFLLGAV